jgi:hypothetical protein
VDGHGIDSESGCGNTNSIGTVVYITEACLGKGV